MTQSPLQSRKMSLWWHTCLWFSVYIFVFEASLLKQIARNDPKWKRHHFQHSCHFRVNEHFSRYDVLKNHFFSPLHQCIIPCSNHKPVLFIMDTLPYTTLESDCFLLWHWKSHCVFSTQVLRHFCFPLSPCHLWNYTWGRGLNWDEFFEQNSSVSRLVCDF